MKSKQVGRWLRALLYGAWLPVVVSCNPSGLGGVVRVVDHVWDDWIVVEERCDWCFWEDWWGGGIDIDFYYDD